MPSELRATIHACILSVAADLGQADLDALAPDADLRDELDIDSMDFLNILIAIKDATGVEVPEADYPQVRTLAGLQAYLQGRTQR